MTGKYIEIKKVLLGLVVAFSVLFLNALSVKEVYAYLEFSRDHLIITEGEMVYLPHYISGNISNKTITYYWDEEDIENPVVILLGSETDKNQLWIGGNKPGTVNIYVEDSYGDMDVLKVSVIEAIEADWISGTAEFGFYPGHVIKSHSYTPSVYGIHRFIVNSKIPSNLIVMDEDGNLCNAVEANIPNGDSYIGAMDVTMNAGQTYYLMLGLFTSASPDMGVNSWEVNSVKVTTGIVKAPTSVSMNVDTTNVLSVDGEHYYIFEGDTLPVNVSFSGEQFFYEEDYEVATTNSAIAVVEDKENNTFVIRGVHAGTVDVSMTTTGLLTDSVKVTVLDESDISIIGDVDVDGEITIRDLDRIYAVVHGTAEKTKIFDYADINEDGQLDMNDVQVLMEQLGYTRFVDVIETDWFYDTVDYVYENGIMTGMDDIHFGPYGTLSRAQFALILYRMEGEPEYNKEYMFSDINGDEWYGPAVLWAADNDIVSGYEDGRFGPGDLITREQLSVVLYRYARYREYDYNEKADLSGFADAQLLSGFANDSMRWAIAKGIITGKENGTVIDPQGATARAEAATIIKRFKNIYE